MKFSKLTNDKYQYNQHTPFLIYCPKSGRRIPTPSLRMGNDPRVISSFEKFDGINIRESLFF